MDNVIFSSSSDNLAIEVSDVYKSYGKVKALDGVSLNVTKGTIHALLGPNGAGKTTLVRILATLLKPSHGSAKVEGYDVLKDEDEIKKTIGLTGQFVALDENLTGEENLTMIGKLYHLENGEVKQRTNELLKLFELDEASQRRVKTYSGGMKRRLDIALSLIGKPQILFLDEPTTGLDPKSRIGLWETIRALVKQGTTVLLTTQYLEEADELADYITLINHGKVIAEGTAKQLKLKVGGDVIEIHVAKINMIEKAASSISELGRGRPEINLEEQKVRLPVEGRGALADVVRKLDEANVDVADISLRRPTLDEVFLSLV